MQRGPSAYDVPHHFSLSAVTQIPGGRTGPKLVRKLTGGWQNAIIVQQQSGRPWNLPTNILYVKDASAPVDWKQPVVQGVTACVAQWNNNGAITMLQYSADAGCTSANWVVSPRYSPRYEPNRETSVRLQGFRLIALNSFFLTNQGFDSSATSTTFGSIVKAGVSAPNSNYPRQAQLGFKLLW